MSALVEVAFMLTLHCRFGVNVLKDGEKIPTREATTSFRKAACSLAGVSIQPFPAGTSITAPLTMVKATPLPIDGSDEVPLPGTDTVTCHVQWPLLAQVVADTEPSRTSPGRTWTLLPTA